MTDTRFGYHECQYSGGSPYPEPCLICGVPIDENPMSADYTRNREVQNNRVAARRMALDMESEHRDRSSLPWFLRWLAR